MKYALLAYDTDRALDALPASEKRALHAGHAGLHRTESDVTVIAHYRFRPAQLVSTVRVEAGTVIRDNGSAGGANGTPRALYLVESDEIEAVVSFAAELPASGAGATIEIWPLSEPSPHLAS
jgi:hypothetical protein